MKKTALFVFCLILINPLVAEVIEKKFFFRDHRVTASGSFQTLVFDNTVLSGIPGEPVFPYQQVTILLPPGQCAESMELVFENEYPVPGKFLLWPQQLPRTLSGEPDTCLLRNLEVYRSDDILPHSAKGQLKTMFLNGYSIAVSSFTPMRYNPARQSISYFQSVTVRIITKPDLRSTEALENLPAAGRTVSGLPGFIQNPGMLKSYPEKKSTELGYQMLIITPGQFGNTFQELLDYHDSHDIQSKLTTVEYISSHAQGQDLQEKIRNYIKAEYQENGIEYLLLGGDVEHVPVRGLYAEVQSSTVITDNAIPADLYYAALDGTWNDPGLPNGHPNLWGEPGEEDLLPELSVGRMTFSTIQELERMIHKTISYQANPIAGEIQHPFLAGEFLYSSPQTFGSDYLDLLINDHADNGFFTHGIPDSSNEIEPLYDSVTTDSVIWQWSRPLLLSKINSGKSFIHHDGHCNVDNMMRMGLSDITDENFSSVNGTDHNYQLLYTQGCLCGAFDSDDCIAEKCVGLTNFLVAGVFNSRYGWFNQGTTDGPGIRLHREFTSALYHDSLPVYRLGDAHRISKIMTAPWVTMPGEFEPGAQRWSQYCNNVLGDPALFVWTSEQQLNSIPLHQNQGITAFPVPCHDQVEIQFPTSSDKMIRITMFNLAGQTVHEEDYNPGAPGIQKVTLHFHSLKPGMYLCELKGSGASKKFKLVVN
mgnify:CR=1 FL=1